MLKDRCAQFEDCLSRGEEPSEELRAHVAQCPECGVLAATGFKLAPVPTAPEDAVVQTTLSHAEQIAARYQRRRRRIPLLIGFAGYALGAVGTVVAFLPAQDGPAAPASEPASLFAAPSLPPPSPATVGLVLLVSIVWMAGVLAWASRKARQEAPSTPSA